MSQTGLSEEYICSGKKKKNYSVFRYHLDPWPTHLLQVKFVSEVWAILDQGERRNARDKNIFFISFCYDLNLRPKT